MSNYNNRRGTSTIMELRAPNVSFRRTESNLENDFSGAQVFEPPPNKGLRRISSTLDFFSAGLRDTKANTEGGCNDILRSNAASCINGINRGYDTTINNGISSSRIPCPPPSVLFSNGGVILRQKTYVPTQQPISRPSPKLVVSNSDPTATTSTPNNVKFPPTVNVTNSLWAIYEDELSKQPPRLRKENTVPLPKLTTQPEWPLLRHQTGLARVNRSWKSKEEREAITKKSFEDSLFPGGLDAFMQLNIQQRAINSDGIQLRLTSPPPISYTKDVSSQNTYPPLLRAMSGKQLIVDLQAYEYSGKPIPIDLGHSNDTHNIYNHIEKDSKQYRPHSLLELRPELPTHDADGRKRKGFRRGDDALQLAISEKWACMAHSLNAPFEKRPYCSRFFVIKSNCELDIFASLKHGIWTSTDLGNKRLDKAFRDTNRRGPIYLFFSVSGSGKFCGLAEMTSPVDLTTHAGIWSDKRWRGRFNVQWKIIKDIVNSDLRQFRVANNDNKPFTNCRDTQEILSDVGENVFHLFTSYMSSSSLLQSTYPAPKYGHEEEHRL